MDLGPTKILKNQKTTQNSHISMVVELPRINEHLQI